MSTWYILIFPWIVDFSSHSKYEIQNFREITNHISPHYRNNYALQK